MTIPSSASTWASLRDLYPLYTALASEFVIEMQSCPQIEGAHDAPAAATIAEAENWFESMDQRIQAHQLRQYLQTSGSANEGILRQMIEHHLGKKHRTQADRDKVDFLLVQFFSQHAPSDLSDSALSFEAVAQSLEPVLGRVDGGEPKWLEPLSDLLSEATNAKNLNWLLTTRIIERGRELKHSCGEKFFEPAAMVAFTRFGFLVRRKFFRLLHQDLNAILDGLRALESRGVTTLDCRKAQFSADEPIARLRMICQSWKVMFHAEYSSGQPLCILVDLRTAVESVLAQQQAQGEIEAQPKARAVGAATGVISAPELEVSSAPTTWNGNSGKTS